MPVIHPHDRKDSTIRGEDYGASISLILDESEPGQGPRLHRHAYDETWVIQQGNITFRVGAEQFTAGPGDVAVIPAGAPHKFTNKGARPLEDRLHPRQSHDRRRMARMTRPAKPTFDRKHAPVAGLAGAAGRRHRATFRRRRGDCLRHHREPRAAAACRLRRGRGGSPHRPVRPENHPLRSPAAGRHRPAISARRAPQSARASLHRYECLRRCAHRTTRWSRRPGGRCQGPSRRPRLSR
jgi:quercetin dioxygenase-like cupin family protein